MDERVFQTWFTKGLGGLVNTLQEWSSAGIRLTPGHYSELIALCDRLRNTILRMKPKE